MGSTDAGSVLTTSDADRGSSSLLSKNPESRPSQPPSSASDLSAAGAGCRTAGSELLLVLVETTAAVEAGSTLTGAADGEAAERSTAASDVRVVTAAMPSAVVLAGSLVVAGAEARVCAAVPVALAVCAAGSFVATLSIQLRRRPNKSGPSDDSAAVSGCVGRSPTSPGSASTSSGNTSLSLL